jgi:hypothetical protein
MNQLGWIDFSPTHHNRVMLVMDLFKEQGVIDELGLGTIRDALSDIMFPGTSTIQTRAKYFLLIPWIFQDIEKRSRIDRFYSDLEESEINFVKCIRNNSPNENGIIGATLRNANPKRKPSSIYWNGLRTYDILNFKGSINDYINYLRYYTKKQQKLKKEIAEVDDNIPGDDKDVNHLNQNHLWCQLPKPPDDWKTKLIIDLSEVEAKFLKEKIIRSNCDSLFSFALIHIPNEAKGFSSIKEFLSVRELPDNLKEIVKLAVDFNTIMQGALIYYNLLIQSNRENGRIKELNSIWTKYWKMITRFQWSNWSNAKLWKYCPYTQFPTKRFVESWIDIVKAKTFDHIKATQLIKDRELKLKGIKRAKLSDKSVAQKQNSFTGISIFDDGSVIYLRYRWNTVSTFINDIQNAIS